jgi:hypothetical protein
MTRISRNLTIATLAAPLLAFAQPWITPIRGGDPAASLDVAIAGPVLANFPVQLKLTITNRGRDPLSYRCAGPGTYPSADTFVAIVSDSTGAKRKVRLRNGQYEGFSCQLYDITDTQSLPAALDPLLPGAYTIRVVWLTAFFVAHDPAGHRRAATKLEEFFLNDEVSTEWLTHASPPLSIRVGTDPVKVAAAEKGLLARAENDPFASYVAECYGISPEVTQWLRQLLSDPQRGMEVVGRLQHMARLPPGGAEVLKEATIKYCRPPVDDASAKLLYQITFVARDIQTDETLEVLAVIARADVAARLRKTAFDDLFFFRQKRVEEVLLDLATRKGDQLHWDAIRELGARGNGAALAPLLQELKNSDPARRANAVFSLGGLKHTPAARDALVTALRDSDPRVREWAKSALGPSDRR